MRNNSREGERGNQRERYTEGSMGRNVRDRRVGRASGRELLLEEFRLMLGHL